MLNNIICKHGYNLQICIMALLLTTKHDKDKIHLHVVFMYNLNPEHFELPLFPSIYKLLWLTLQIECLKSLFSIVWSHVM